MPDPEQIARLYLSPRAIELDVLDRYITCTQYEGRVPWFSTASDTPLFERKPCINYPIGKSAIGSHVSFVLGEGRWPKLTSATSEDDRNLDADWGLSQDESDVLDRFVNVVLCRYVRLKQVAREMLHDAMASRSVAVVASVKGGRLCAETVKASWCTPTLNTFGECTKLEIRYPFIQSYYNDQKHKWDTRCMIYRRVIDATSDTVFLPAIALENGKEPQWAPDKTKTVEHKLGFCPVLWYPFMKPCSTAENIDGIAIHEHQLGEIDCLNIALSQKQRAAVTAGDPQLYETGVNEDHNPAPMGTAGRGAIDMSRMGSDGKPIGIFSSSYGSRAMGRMIARKRGAGVVWRYPDKDTKVGYLTVPSDALKAVDEHARDLRSKIAESFSVVFIDPGEIKMHAAMSGKALSFLFARQLAFDDGIREDFADKALLPLVSMLLRIVLVVGRVNPRGLYIPGVVKVLPVLESFEREVANDNENDPAAASGGKMWMPPRLEPVWGPYFAANEQDQLFVVQLVCQALLARAITKHMAVEKLAQSGVFDVGSAKEVVEAISKEADEAQAKLHKTMKTLGVSDDGGEGNSDTKPAPPASKPGDSAAAA